MNKKSLVFIAIIIVSGLSCKREEWPVVRETTAMNSYVSIKVYDKDRSGREINTAIDSAFAEIKRVEAYATNYNDSSEIGRANLAAGTDSIIVSEELAGLIRKSLAFGDSSSGAFDITVGPLENLWDFLAAHPRLPSPDSVRSLLPLVGYRLVFLRDRTLYLPRTGMALDLGAIGKGFAVDKAMAVLSRKGVTKAIVDLSGNLGVLWPGTNGLDSAIATISIRHPRHEGAFLGTFRYGAGGISTSGDYERCFVVNGIRYHHILNPATGYPAGGVVSVTIVAPNATDADAISTLVFVLGREKGMTYIRNHPGVEGIIVHEIGDSLGIDLSPGFQGKLSLAQAHANIHD